MYTVSPLVKAYLHSMNVIHRDLNSHNCLVREVSKFLGQNKSLKCMISDALL